MSEVYMGKRINYTYNLATAKTQLKDELKQKISLLESKLYLSLKTIFSEEFNVSQMGENSDTFTMLDNSFYYLKHQGKVLVTKLLDLIDTKEISDADYQRFAKKIDAYIRITDRKINAQDLSMKRIEINSVWARETLSNLQRDLKLEQLEDIKVSRNITISFETENNTTWEAKKIA